MHYICIILLLKTAKFKENDLREEEIDNVSFIFKMNRMIPLTFQTTPKDNKMHTLQIPVIESITFHLPLINQQLNCRCNLQVVTNKI